MIDPVKWWNEAPYLNRDEALIALARAIRAEVLEEAAKVCEAEWRLPKYTETMRNAVIHGCIASAAAIRSLKEGHADG